MTVWFSRQDCTRADGCMSSVNTHSGPANKKAATRQLDTASASRTCVTPMWNSDLLRVPRHLR
eukprot:11827885-Alexandrium_andersonii.AAC.1